jgi:hypothetical protein
MEALDDKPNRFADTTSTGLITAASAAAVGVAAYVFSRLSRRGRRVKD